MCTLVNALTGRDKFIESLAPANALLAFGGYRLVLIALSSSTCRFIEEPARFWFKRSVARGARS